MNDDDDNNNDHHKKMSSVILILYYVLRTTDGRNIFYVNDVRLIFHHIWRVNRCIHYRVYL